MQLQWVELGDSYPLFAPAGTPVPDWPLPHSGRYRFAVLVDGSPVSGGPLFYGLTPGAQVPVPSGVPQQGFALEWAHVADHAFYQKYLIIERISEFYHLPPRAAGGVFNGHYVAMVSGGSEVARRHKFRVEMKDSDGNSLRSFPESLINFESAGAGHLLKASVVMPMEKVVFPGPGEYEFVAHIDGQRIGETDYRVLHGTGP